MKKLIFESPDGGKTVYAREPGSTDKTLIQCSEEDAAIYQSVYEKFQEENLWKDIRKEALNNPKLKHALDQCIILYWLSKGM